MAANEIRVGDVGTVLRLTVKDGDSIIDLSTADTIQILLRRPNGKSLTKTASLTTDGSDGQMQYVTEAGVLDQAGIWQLQGRIAFVGGNQWSTDIEDIEVYPNLA